MMNDAGVDFSHMDYTHALQLAMVNAMREEEQGGINFVEKVRGHTDFSTVIESSGQLLAAFLRRYGQSELYRSLQEGKIGAKEAAWKALGSLRQEAYRDTQSLNSFWADFSRRVQGLQAAGVALDAGSDNFQRAAMIACDGLENPVDLPALTQWIMYRAVELDRRPGGKFWNDWFEGDHAWSDPSNGVTYKYTRKGSWAAAARTPSREKPRDHARGVSRQTQDREEHVFRRQEGRKSSIHASVQQEDSRAKT